MSSFDFRTPMPPQSFSNHEAIEAICALGQEVFDVARFEIKRFEGGQFHDMARLGLEDFAEIGYHDFFDRAHRPSLGLIIHDLSANVRTAIEPMVISGPRLRFYADMPIFDHGILRGIVCIYDQLPANTPTKRIERQLLRFAQLCAPLLRPTTPAPSEPEQVFGVFRLNLLTREMWSSPALLEILELDSDTTLNIDEFLSYFSKPDAETLILSFWQSVSQCVDFDLHLPIQTSAQTSKALILRGGIDKQSDASQLWLCAVVSPAYEGGIAQDTDWQDRVTQAVVAPLKTISEFGKSQASHFEPPVAEPRVETHQGHDSLERLHNDLLRARRRLDELEAQMPSNQSQNTAWRIDRAQIDQAYLHATMDGLNLRRL